MSVERQSRRRVRVERGIYRQPNGKYAVCFMAEGRPRFRTVGHDLDAARIARAGFIDAMSKGISLAAPELRFARVSGWWIARYERRVGAGERRERTLENHRYHLERHLLPVFGPRLMRSIRVGDVAELITDLRARGRSEKTVAGALATLQSVVRFAIRNGWIAENPVERLETGERPRPSRRRQRVLGREEITRLLEASAPRYRPLISTALYIGLRISELLGLIWSDLDLDTGELQVTAQLSRARRGSPARRVPPKTPAALRDVPLTPQLVGLLREYRAGLPATEPGDWVFATGAGTPLGHRNAERRGLNAAAGHAGLDSGHWPNLRSHDLRHTFASRLIVDLRLDVAQVSRILGHAHLTTTLDVYTHLFDEARHSTELRAQLAGSAFADLLKTGEDDAGGGELITLPHPRPMSGGPLSARERTALRWVT